MNTIKFSYNPSDIYPPYIEEMRTAFSELGFETEFAAGAGSKNSLRVFAYRQPHERDYVFSPYPAIGSEVNASPKKIDVLFAGRISDPDKMKDAWRGLSGRRHELCLRVAKAIENEYFSFDTAVNAALLDMGCLSDLPKEVREYLNSQISVFMAALNGFNMLKELLDAGIKVVYSGTRSYCSLYKHPNLIIEKAPPPPKILVYAHPFLGYGASHALLTAMGSGTVAATDSNGFMDEFFPEAIKAIPCFTCNTKDENRERFTAFSANDSAYVKQNLNVGGNFAERVHRLLERPAELHATAELLREKVLNRHMPIHRAAKILLALDVSGRNEVSLYG